MICLARHGETEWSKIRQHTRLTDLPLTSQGERNARTMGEHLKRWRFTAVFTSPLQRARRTCELAGFGDRATVDADMAEWNYGDYKGQRTVAVRKDRPDWNPFRNGCPNGETAVHIGAQADTDAVAFGHRHFLCVLAVR